MRPGRRESCAALRPPSPIRAARVAGISVDVEVVQDVTDEVVKAFGRLLPQLSRSAKPLDAEALQTLVAWRGNRLLIARVAAR